ncbi:hypothetical protein GBAR_LOCUS23560 [Geodia barretti]|uniref:Uncharacterized protein n=1 Tax=Geodia barretti TaxID=519541 RepID=A0AA35X7G4_GEOBA|nr:hypothetical protein GBAR_LOCUS23560 [Geodia barretti]
MSKKGEGDVSICYCRLQCFLRQRLHCYSLEQGSDGNHSQNTVCNLMV